MKEKKQVLLMFLISETVVGIYELKHSLCEFHLHMLHNFVLKTRKGQHLAFCSTETTWNILVGQSQWKKISEQ